MKIFRLLGLLICLNGISQTSIVVTVKDANTQKPLAFCNVFIKGTSMGGITNKDGKINIKTSTLKDTLVISYLGYKTKQVQVFQLQNNNEVYLKSSPLSLSEVYVMSDDAYLYDILKKCRKAILRSKQKTVSKAYHCLETQMKSKPMEFLECYYNGNHQGSKIESLDFKNGRIAFSTVDNNHFMSIDISKLMYETDITQNIGRLPYLPLQVNKNKAKRFFRLKMIGMNAEMYHLSFEPRSDKHECFSGALWIDRKTFEPIKIECRIDNAKHYGIVPIAESDSLKEVSFFITNAYKTVSKHKVLDYINFSYKFTYQRHPDPNSPFSVSLLNRINIESTIYFYDYGQSFILPYYDYGENITELGKVWTVPYNKTLWEENNKLILTQEQKEKLGVFKQLGTLVNFPGAPSLGKSPIQYSHKGIINEHMNGQRSKVFWGVKKRIILPRDRAKQERYKQYTPEMIAKHFKRDLYHLQAQILLDVTQVKDSLICRSFTVFDADESTYHLPEYTYTRAFLNIFFDICEIERRKMQAELDASPYSKLEIDAIYEKANTAMQTITQKYISEVDAGKKFSALKRWNKYVFEHLGIDNIDLVDETNKAIKEAQKEN